MDEQLKNDLNIYVNSIESTILEWRHHFHAHPELSFNETNTSAYIKEILKSKQIEYTEGWAGTGILAKISGNKAGKRKLFRADMDALPIQEKNEVAYKSKTEGVMHACGHDVHMTCLLGMIHVIHEYRDKLEGEIYFVFQPGEEKLPGGAKLLIEQGILKQGPFDAIVALHVSPELECGKVGIKSGAYMASADEIYIKVFGNGGHAAMPHQSNDTVLASCQIVTSLQQVVSRRCNPLTPSVLSFGKINSEGGATNVLPEMVKIEGTFRTFDEKWRYEAHEAIKSICRQTAAAYEVACEIDIQVGYPFLTNNEELCKNVKQIMISTLGKDNVVDLPMRMTSEDFSFYSQKAPACFFRLGTGNLERKITAGVHNPHFDIDESALATGVTLLSCLGFEL